MARKDVARAGRTGLNGLSDVTLAKTVTVADVQGGDPDVLRMVLHITATGDCNAFA